MSGFAVWPWAGPVSYTHLDVYKRQDYGRVLVGVQVPEAERAQFAQYIRDLDYPHSDETDNPAYRLFLDGRS